MSNPVTPVDRERPLGLGRGNDAATPGWSTETALLASVPDRLFIAGRWEAGSSLRHLDVFDPATGELLRRIADATPDDGARALDAAAAASEDWAQTAPRVRGEVLRSAFDLLMQRRDEAARLISLEMGKPLSEAAGEVAYGAEFLRWFAEEAVRISGRYGENPDGTGRMLVSRRPVGPSYLITPWNFPLAMATRKIAPALAAGCTAVVKPAELTPLSTLFLTQIFEEVGLPAGVLNVVTTSDAAGVSERIIGDPRLRKLSFTGSTRIGRFLLKQAADTVLRTSMELGGNAAFVVFADADIDRAVEGAMTAKFRNSGQACTAANRFLVHSSIAAEFTRRLAARVADLRVGAGTEQGVEIGPLITHDAVDKVDQLVRDAVSRGAELATGGRRRDGVGSFYEPTVLAAVPSDSDILREEIFGPVAAIVEFETEAEAVRLANDTEYGLVAYVYTEDLALAQRMIDRLDTGMMGVNVGAVSDASAPFGGVKQSGVGREGGIEGIQEYLSTKYTLIPAS